MSNSIAPGSSAYVNVKVTALTTNPNVPVTYKTIILKKNLVNGVNTLTQEMMSTTNTKYVIKYDYILGEDVTIPENCILEFDGGSISKGTLILSDNVTIEGNGTICFPYSVADENNNITNKCFIFAYEVSNITIKNITLKGAYLESMGYLAFGNRPNKPSEHFIYIGKCSNVVLDNVTISNFFSNKVPNPWYEVFSSKYGLFPFLIHNSKNVIIKDFTQRESCGEACNIFYSENVTVDNFVSINKYIVSELTIMYCEQVYVRKSHFERTTGFAYVSGNLVNIFSSGLDFSSNVITGGDYDYGNEHVNAQYTEDYSHVSYVCDNVIISDNIFNGCKVTNNTAVPAGGELPEYVIKNISILRNTFTDTLKGVSCGARGGIVSSIIDSNIFNCFTSEELTADSRYQQISAFNNCPDSLIIKNNVFDCSDAVFDYNFNNTKGAILVNGGATIIIQNNSIKGNHGIHYMSGNATLLIDGNRFNCHHPNRIAITGNLVYSNNSIKYATTHSYFVITISGTYLKYFGNYYHTDKCDTINATVDFEDNHDNNFVNTNKNINLPYRNVSKAMDRRYFTKTTNGDTVKYLKFAFDDYGGIYKLIITSGYKFYEGILRIYNSSTMTFFVRGHNAEDLEFYTDRDKSVIIGLASGSIVMDLEKISSTHVDFIVDRIAAVPDGFSAVSVVYN